MRRSTAFAGRKVFVAATSDRRWWNVSAIDAAEPGGLGRIPMSVAACPWLRDDRASIIRYLRSHFGPKPTSVAEQRRAGQDAAVVVGSIL